MLSQIPKLYFQFHNDSLSLSQCSVTSPKRSLWKIYVLHWHRRGEVAHTAERCKHKALYSPMILNKRLKRTNKLQANVKAIKIVQTLWAFFPPSFIFSLCDNYMTLLCMQVNRRHFCLILFGINFIREENPIKMEQTCE